MKRTIITSLTTLAAVKVGRETKIFIVCDRSLAKYLDKKKFDREVKRQIRQLRKEGEQGRASEAILMHNVTDAAFLRA